MQKVAENSEKQRKKDKNSKKKVHNFGYLHNVQPSFFKNWR